MKWGSNNDNDPGMDDREFWITTAFWLLLAAAVITLFALGLAKIGG